jgi:DNA-binding response OmpR family regulator
MRAVKATKPKRILHVEDDADNREMVGLMLSGHQVISVGTYAAGLVAAQQQNFDLYLIDNQLTDGVGIDLCREIRRFDKDTPIVFCSGFTDNAHQRTALNIGANAFLAKPFDRGRLVAVVEEQLAKRQR